MMTSIIMQKKKTKKKEDEEEGKRMTLPFDSNEAKEVEAKWLSKHP